MHFHICAHVFSEDSCVMFWLGLAEGGDFLASRSQDGSAIEKLFVPDTEELRGGGRRMLVLFSLLGTVITPLLEEPS